MCTFFYILRTPTIWVMGQLQAGELLLCLGGRTHTRGSIDTLGGGGGTPPVCYNLTTPLAKAFQCWHSACSFETSACRLLTSNESLIPSRESCLCLLPSPSLLTIPSCSLSSDSLSLTISCCKKKYIITI